MGRRPKKNIAARTPAVTHRSGLLAPESGNRLAGLNDRWMVLGVCIFLAAITWLVFGQTLRHEFINYDDDQYVFAGVLHNHAFRPERSSLLFSATLLLGISVFVLVMRRRGYFVTGWLWYLVMLGPVIGILKVSE